MVHDSAYFLLLLDGEIQRLTRRRAGYGNLLFAAYKFHQFGLGLGPILVRAIVGPIARLVDLVGAELYRFMREGARRILREGRTRFRKDGFPARLNLGLGHFYSWTATTKRRKLQNG